MRLGAPIFREHTDPESWVEAVKKSGYGAAYCPIGAASDDDTVRAYRDAAEKADITIGEVGAWGNNPLSTDENARRESIRNIQERLDLADRIGARCCVTTSGSLGRHWHNPFSEEVFGLIVESVRETIDGVKPTRTFYTLELLPRTHPHSTESYHRLTKAIDRKQFGVHFDPVNMIYSPERYYNNGALIQEFVAKLGPHIRSCHAKDILLGRGFPARLDETRPGLGKLDYGIFLREINKLDQEPPLMLEHLSTEEEYSLAADYIRSVAEANGLTFR